MSTKYMQIHTYDFTTDVCAEIWDHDRGLWKRFTKITPASLDRLNWFMRWHRNSAEFAICPYLNSGEKLNRESTTTTINIYRTSQ